MAKTRRTSSATAAGAFVGSRLSQIPPPPTIAFFTVIRNARQKRDRRFNRGYADRAGNAEGLCRTVLPINGKVSFRYVTPPARFLSRFCAAQPCLLRPRVAVTVLGDPLNKAHSSASIDHTAWPSLPLYSREIAEHRAHPRASRNVPRSSCPKVVVKCHQTHPPEYAHRISLQSFRARPLVNMRVERLRNIRPNDSSRNGIKILSKAFRQSADIQVEAALRLPSSRTVGPPSLLKHFYSPAARSNDSSFRGCCR
jgi:hypothetical protein